MKKNTALAGFLHALGAVAYVGLVTFIMNHANAWFGEGKTPFQPMAFLMLFVLSAAVMGSLVFLRPILWYINNAKREALELLGWTIGFFFIFTLIVFASLAAIH